MCHFILLVFVYYISKGARLKVNIEERKTTKFELLFYANRKENKYVNLVTIKMNLQMKNTVLLFPSLSLLLQL